MAESKASEGKRRPIGKWLLVAAPALIVVISVAFIVLLARWPFNREAVARALAHTFSGNVEIKKFRSTYFPHPGCVAEGVTFRDGRSMGSIEKLTIQGDYSHLLTGQKRLHSVIAEGLSVRVLPSGQTSGGSRAEDGSSDSGFAIGTIVADGSVLEVDRGNPQAEPLRFEIHRLTLREVGAGREMLYRVALRNPEPGGEIQSEGRFGPWQSGDHGKTPLSGSYTFRNANLGTFNLVEGTLSSKGDFSGILSRIAVTGTTDVPDFDVKSSGHTVHLSTRFRAVVNGTNGDVLLDPVDSHLARTGIVAQGGIAGKSGQHGKTLSLEISTRDGHIQDLMRLLMKSNQPPMTGLISFRAKAIVPPDNRKFLERVDLQGDFGIADAQFTASSTRRNIDVLSERARGQKNDDDNPENVISNLKGHVVLRNGVAKFSNLSFGVPGAVAQLEGTYNLLTERIDLHGTLATEAKLSQETKGAKSFLLKALDPFFKRKDAGAVIPVQITGTYSHPSYGIALPGKKLAQSLKH